MSYSGGKKAERSWSRSQEKCRWRGKGEKQASSLAQRTGAPKLEAYAL